MTSSVSRAMFLVLATISAVVIPAFGCGGDQPADPPTPQTAARAADPAVPSATARATMAPKTPRPADTPLPPQPAAEPPTPVAPAVTPTAADGRVQPRPSPISLGVDREALVALYEATDGPNWTNNANWLSNEPLDAWRGVTTDDSGRVIGLHLGGNGLSREIPSELGSLANLKVLDLSRNELGGQIPSELGSLANLVELRLSDNHLSGTVPREAGSLSKLRALFLDGNRLTGELPHGLTRLPTTARLPFLYLHDNAGLCAPDDDTFLAWLDGVRHALGFVCDPTGDRALLIALYNATNGPSWDNKANWLSSEPLDAWRGVTTDDSGRVIRLDLGGNRLSGQIPT